jgi:hypothetical protein
MCACSADARRVLLLQTARLLDFWRNHRAVHTTIVHFQLRNLVWATSPHDVYVMLDSCVNHWSTVSRQITQVLIPKGEG